MMPRRGEWGDDYLGVDVTEQSLSALRNDFELNIRPIIGYDDCNL